MVWISPYRYMVGVTIVVALVGLGCLMPRYLNFQNSSEIRLFLLNAIWMTVILAWMVVAILQNRDRKKLLSKISELECQARMSRAMDSHFTE